MNFLISCRREGFFTLGKSSSSVLKLCCNGFTKGQSRVMGWGGPSRNLLVGRKVSLKFFYTFTGAELVPTPTHWQARLCLVSSPSLFPSAKENESRRSSEVLRDVRKGQKKPFPPAMAKFLLNIQPHRSPPGSWSLERGGSPAMIKICSKGLLSAPIQKCASPAPGGLPCLYNI